MVRKKFIFVFLLAVSIAVSGHGQIRSSSQTLQRPDKNKLRDEIETINRQVEALKNAIQEDLKYYKQNPIYGDAKVRNLAVRDLNAEIEKLKCRADSLSLDLAELEEALQMTDKILRDYYEKDIDSLYELSNMRSLQIHKQMLEGEPPQIMNDLEILFACLDLLENECDETKIAGGLEQLEKVRECYTKKYIRALLIWQKTIAGEVNHWLQGDDHSWFALALFRGKLYEDYGVNLDIDYPYLASEVRKVLVPVSQ